MTDSTSTTSTDTFASLGNQVGGDNAVAIDNHVQALLAEVVGRLDAKVDELLAKQRANVAAASGLDSTDRKVVAPEVNKAGEATKAAVKAVEEVKEKVEAGEKPDDDDLQGAVDSLKGAGEKVDEVEASLEARLKRVETTVYHPIHGNAALRGEIDGLGRRVDQIHGNALRAESIATAAMHGSGSSLLRRAGTWALITFVVIFAVYTALAVWGLFDFGLLLAIGLSAAIGGVVFMAVVAFSPDEDDYQASASSHVRMDEHDGGDLVGFGEPQHDGAHASARAQAYTGH